MDNKLTVGLPCKECGSPIEYKQSTLMLCKKCSRKHAIEQSKKTLKERYGVSNPMHNKEFVDKIQATMQEKYGANCAMNVPQFREKFIDTCQERYGVSYYVNSEQFVNKSQCKSSINQKFYKELQEANIPAIQEFMLQDKRFDFKLIDRNILIEIDPTYTHNSAGSHFDPNGIDANYQSTKTLIAEKNGYRCIHIFDWDDWAKMIEIIQPVKSTVYARKCSISVIQDKSYADFIEANHIQGQCKGTKIAIGLYYDSDLVQVMTFGKPRYNKNYQWELLRLCTKRGCNVIGGASKLFKYATITLGLTSIISYCDRAKFTGQVYYKIGMTLLKETQPQEIWSKGNKYVTGTLLRQRGYDQLFDANYGKGTSNEELMLQNGWLPIYDCGQLVFTYGAAICSDKHEEGSDYTPNYHKIIKSIEKSKEKLCLFCNKPFIPKCSSQKYCEQPHYMTCPICGKQYLVTNNENLKRPPVACSYACRAKKTQQTSIKKYGCKAPGNNPEARVKAKQSMQTKYGVDYTLQSNELRNKVEQTMVDRYGVNNFQKIPNNERITSTKDIWIEEVHKLLPIKLAPSQPHLFRIDEDKMSVFLLRETASKEFLKNYGWRLVHKFRKTHMSIGLVQDGILYQVLRFEKVKDDIILADFGTRSVYFNPRGYAKLMKFAIEIRGIDSFIAEIPKNLATNEVIQSLNLEKVAEKEYEVYWKTENGLKKLSRHYKIKDYLAKWDYITTDYIDIYAYKEKQQTE